MATFRRVLVSKKNFLASPFPSQRTPRLHASFSAFSGKFKLVSANSNVMDLALPCRKWKLEGFLEYIRRNCPRCTNSSGKFWSFSLLFGVPLAMRLQSLCPAECAMDSNNPFVNRKASTCFWGNQSLVETHYSDVSDGSNQWKEDAFWMWGSKFLVPIIAFLTLMIGWRHPLKLAINLTLLLYSTKPRPLSVYLFIDQWHQPSRWRHGLDRMRLSPANKVDIQDFGVLCLAWADLGDKEVVLIGILGGWWVLRSSPRSTLVSLVGVRNLSTYTPW